jgi:hypothetical protein
MGFSQAAAVETGYEHHVMNSSLLLLYYFYVPPASGSAETNRYPVWPSFEHWSYPHRNLPPMWAPLMSTSSTVSAEAPLSAPLAASNLSTAIRRRDKCWRVTAQKDYVETAHLVPRTEAGWFRSSAMSQCNPDGQLPSEMITDDISNAIASRSDIHSAFDDKKFVIIPKYSQ